MRRYPDGCELLTLLTGHYSSRCPAISVQPAQQIDAPLRFEFEVDAAYTQETSEFVVLGGLHTPAASLAIYKKSSSIPGRMVSCALIVCDLCFRHYGADLKAEGTGA